MEPVAGDFFNSIDPKRTLHRSGSTAKPPWGQRIGIVTHWLVFFTAVVGAWGRGRREVPMTAVRLGIVMLVGLAILSAIPVGAQQANMTFFVTSVGMGKGADLGGLAGADQHCQELAASVGAGSNAWHVYLSTQGPGAVNARDRIGKGPWMNTKGEIIAKDVAELHGAN